jgi:hypothetical protein
MMLLKRFMDLDAKLTLSPSADQRDASLLAGTIRTDPQQRIRNGTLVFNRSDVVTFPGLASGSGGLAQIVLGPFGSPYFPRLLLRSLRWNKFFPPLGNVRTLSANNKRGRACPNLQHSDPEQPDLPVSYNIAPSQDILAIRFNPETGERSLDQLRWGLIPHWGKGPKDCLPDHQCQS